ncbi:MAG: hypothetical protein IJU14_02870 [Clostridia bacterium]|nr:hypothetical protein [Clostridia bacterium]
MNVRKNKIIKIYLELEQVGLIQRKKQGFGKPTKIYVMNFAKSDDETLKNETGNEDVDDEDICEMSELPQSKPQDFLETNVRISLKQTSGLPKNKPQDFPETNPNHTNINHTDNNHTDYQSNLSIHAQSNNAVRMSKADRKEKCDRWSDGEQNSYLLYIRQNLSYDEILQTVGMDRNILDMAVQIILEAYNPQNEYIVIQGQSYPQTVVCEKFETLDSTHIGYVWKCLQKTIRTQKIRNLRKYLQTCLFNVPDTIDSYYDNQRQYDNNSVLNNYAVSENHSKVKKHKASYDISFLENPDNWQYFFD